MNIIKRIKPGVPKRILFFAAALVWSFASYRILILGFADVFANTKSYWINCVIGLVIFYFFFKYVFYRMFLKHTKRIINSENERPCIFSFFDIKGYSIMTFMITGGIFLRKANVIPSLYLGTFYIGLGLSLLSASISFLYSGIRYEKIKIKLCSKNIPSYDGTLK